MSEMSRSRLSPVIAVCVVVFVLVTLYGSCRSPGHTKESSNASLDTADAAVPTIGTSRHDGKKSDEAFVALQFGDFFLGLRVLGQSLREAGTTKDMVVLCMPDVPEKHREILRKEGWVVRSIVPMSKNCIGENADSGRLTKIQGWLLTDYSRVVLIDSDAIVLQNVDELFECGEFCAVYRHSDLFNGGLLVAKPSIETYKGFCKAMKEIAFELEDQGLLNYYYKDLKNASLFRRADKGQGGKQKLRRLASAYNSDAGIFYLSDRWSYLYTDEPYILHYTLGPVKPWKWWSYPLFPLNWRWKNLRDRLPPTDLWEPSLWDWDSWFPLVLLLIYTLTAKLWVGPCTEHISKSSAVRYASTIFNPVGHYTMKIVPNFLLLTALYCGFYQVPQTMYPIEGWTRCGLWTLMFFFLPFSVYCHLSYVVGLQSNGVKGTVLAVRPWNIVMEALLWTILGVVIFYLQFWVTATRGTMTKRTLAFFGLGILNLTVCFWWGRRLTRLCYNLGLSASSSMCNHSIGKSVYST